MEDWESTEDTRRCRSCQRELARNAAASEPASWKPQAVETEDRLPARPCAAVEQEPRGATQLTRDLPC